MWGFTRISVDWYQQANRFSDIREIQRSISLGEKKLSNKHDFPEKRLSLTVSVVVNERLPMLFLHILHQLRYRRCPHTVI